MLELEQAVDQILAAIPQPIAESIDLKQAHGRIAAESIAAPIDLPLFDNSSVDGYAVRAADVAAATSENPVRLRLIGRVAAGESFAGELTSSASVRLFTGSPLPRGADAVVMQEDTRMESAEAREVLVCDPVRPWENVRFRGEDVKRGAGLVDRGEALTLGRIGLLAATGVKQVRVNARPTVGLLATGSELREPGATLAPGQIYESNRLTLAPAIQQTGGIARCYPIVPDTPEDTRRALELAFKECEVVVTCGGVSVGELDFVKSAFESLGGRLEFWKVAIKPGRPFVFGRWREKFLFGLPGNPISAFVTFLLLVRPALARWQGAANVGLQSHPADLTEALANPGERRHFMRVTVDPEGRVKSAGIQASHILSSAALANGLVDVPPRTTLAAGETVRVLRWE